MKDRKNLYKRYAVAGVLSLTIFGIVLLLGSNSHVKQPQNTPELIQCVKDKEVIWGSLNQYEPGNINVFFKTNVTKMEIQTFFYNYGFNAVDIRIRRSYTFAIVNVVHGTEYQWICEFQNNQIVDYAVLSPIMHLL